MRRVGRFFVVVDRLVRTLLTFLMTLTAAKATAVPGFALPLLVLLAASAGAFATRKAMQVPALT